MKRVMILKTDYPDEYTNRFGIKMNRAGTFVFDLVNKHWKDRESGVVVHKKTLTAFTKLYPYTFEFSREAEELRDIIMYVGEQHYSIESFVEEAKKRGVSRRINLFPKDFNIDENVVWLMHRNGAARNEGGTLFGMFRITRAEVIESPEKVAQLKRMDVQFKVISLAEAGLEEKRGCGYRRPGGIYLVSGTDWKQAASISDAIGCGAKDFVELIPTIKTDIQFFRGIKYVDQDFIDKYYAKAQIASLSGMV